MMDRCYLRAHKSFKDYGGRGIKVCERWVEFSNFLSDMGVRPDGRQLGRIDNEGGYSPDNCRWETPRQNSNNKRNNRLLTYDGLTLTVSQWSETLNISSGTLFRRLYAGWEVEDAIKRGVRYMRPSATWNRQT